jgi:hypothetical protein
VQEAPQKQTLSEPRRAPITVFRYTAGYASTVSATAWQVPMLDEDIVARLKSHGYATPLVEALRLVADYGGGAMTQFRAIACLKQAFPHFPLGVLIEASTSKHIIGEGGLTDLEVSQLLRPPV